MSGRIKLENSGIRTFGHKGHILFESGWIFRYLDIKIKNNVNKYVIGNIFVASNICYVYTKFPFNDMLKYIIEIRTPAFWALGLCYNRQLNANTETTSI